MATASRTMSRRLLILWWLAAGATVLTGCSNADRPSSDTTSTDAPTTETNTDPSTDSRPSASTGASTRILLAVFSRAGENYHYGDRIELEAGNTEVLAGMIADRLDCDLDEIEAADPYSDDYDATVRRNVAEQDADARPEIAGRLPSLDAYNVVILASPIWNVRPPMIMKTFTEALDFSGKTIHPVVTYAVSGLGDAARDYTDVCPGATLGAGLAVQGEEVSAAGSDVDTWLTDAGLAPA
jgi:flavodoxin